MQTQNQRRSRLLPATAMAGAAICVLAAPAAAQTPPAVGVSPQETQKFVRQVAALGIKVTSEANGANYFGTAQGYTIVMQALSDGTREMWINLPEMKPRQLTADRMSSALQWNDVHIPALSLNHGATGNPHFSITVYFSSPPRDVTNEIASLQQAANGTRAIWDAGAGK